MAVSRREFMTRSTLLSGGLLFDSSLRTLASAPVAFTVPSTFSLQIMATNWGFYGSVEDFCARAKEAGYDGIEVWYPADEKDQDAMLAATDKHQLVYGFLAAGRDADFATHQSQFEQSIVAALRLKPQFINCHSGRDYFSLSRADSCLTLLPNNLRPQAFRSTTRPIGRGCCSLRT